MPRVAAAAAGSCRWLLQDARGHGRPSGGACGLRGGEASTVRRGTHGIGGDGRRRRLLAIRSGGCPTRERAIVGDGVAPLTAVIVAATAWIRIVHDWAMVLMVLVAVMVMVGARVLCTCLASTAEGALEAPRP